MDIPGTVKLKNKIIGLEQCSGKTYTNAWMYLSTRPNQVKIHKDELVKISAHPSDEYNYFQIL